MTDKYDKSTDKDSCDRVKLHLALLEVDEEVHEAVWQEMQEGEVSRRDWMQNCQWEQHYGTVTQHYGKGQWAI